MKIISFVKIQLSFWFLLTVLVTAPFIAVKVLMPGVNLTMYFALCSLVAIKFIIMNDSNYRKKITPTIVKHLKQELKKLPTKQLTITRVESMVFARDISLIVFGISVVLLNIIL